YSIRLYSLTPLLAPRYAMSGRRPACGWLGRGLTGLTNFAGRSGAGRVKGPKGGAAADAGTKVPAGGDPGIPGRRRGPPRPAGPGGCGVRKEPSMKRVGSGEEAGTGRPAAASRRANTAAPWAAAVVIVVALAAAWFALERGVFTQPWRQAAARELSQALGAPVSVEAVGAGVNRLVLHEVEVDGAWSAAAERVVVGLSWVDVLLRRAAPLEAVRWVEIHGLSVEVPWDGWPGRRSGRAGADEAGEAGAAPEEADPADAAPEWPALSALLQEVERLQGRLRERQQQRPVPAERELLVRWRDGRVRFRLGEGGPAMEAAAEGVVAWRGGRLLMERLTARAAELELTLNGTLFPRTDVYARLVADDLARAMDSLPRDGAGAPVHAAGRVELEAWLTGSS